MIKLRHQANDRISRQSVLNFCEIPRIYQNSAKRQIPQLDSKFRVPRKTVGPISAVVCIPLKRLVVQASAEGDWKMSLDTRPFVTDRNWASLHGENDPAAAFLCRFSALSAAATTTASSLANSNATETSK